MKQSLTIIGLAVEDLGRSLNFYKDGLGWEAGFETEGIAFFQMNGLLFSVVQKKILEDDFERDIQMGGKSVTLAHNVSSKEEVDAVLAKVTALEGATHVQGPVERIWGGYSGYFEDPDGHLWEIAWNPFLKIDAEGFVTL